MINNIHRKTILPLLILLFLSACETSETSQEFERPATSMSPSSDLASTSAKEQGWEFEGLPLHAIPAAFFVDATRSSGPLATWEVISEHGADPPNQVLALMRTHNESDGTFNLCVARGAQIEDGDIEVRVRAVSGSGWASEASRAGSAGRRREPQSRQYVGGQKG